MAEELLVIDDDEMVLKTLNAILRKQSIPFKMYNNPVIALRENQSRNHNVVLVDVIMPEMTGVDVIRRLRADNPMCNAIVMTAFSTMERVIDCLEVGAVDYLTKPFSDIELLLEVVGTAVRRVERWRQSFGMRAGEKV